MLARTMAKSRLNESIPNKTERILFHRRFHSTNFPQPSPFFGFSHFIVVVFNMPLEGILKEGSSQINNSLETKKLFTLSKNALTTNSYCTSSVTNYEMMIGT